MITKLLHRYQTRRSEGAKAHSSKALNRVYLLLHQMQRRRSFLEITIEGDQWVYQSMILSLDPEERTILIDELFPEGFIGLVGQQVLVSIRHEAGRRIQFKSVILERHSQNETPLYVLKMPMHIDFDQRRSAYRLALNSKVATQSTVIANDDRAYTGYLRDVSVDGLCMEIEADDEQPFSCDDCLQQVAFDFAGQSIDCELTVRNVVAIEHSDSDVPQHRWRIGAQFVDLPPVEQRLLEKSIMRIQRDRIKYTGEAELQQAVV